MKGNIKFEMGVGIVFLVAMGILGYYTIFMTKKLMDTKQAYYLSVKFPTAEGLQRESSVKVNGVLSGSVDDITLGEGYVDVKMKMINTFTLYDNYSISITPQSLMGGAQVSINPGNPSDKSGKRRKVITARENLSGTFESPLAAITQLISDNKQNIYLTLRNMREFTDKINRGKGTLAKLVNEDTIHESTNDLMKDLREAIEDTREQAPVTSFIRAALTMF